MDVVGERFDAGGEGLRVGYDGAVDVAVHLPAVVEVDILVARSRQPGVDDGLSGGVDELLVDGTHEVVPRVPSHLRSQRQPVVQSRAATG